MGKAIDRRAGLKQIAEELGVSMMTVSRALNGRGDVAESLGLEVGRDLSVVGFGALQETKWLRPRLATLDQKP